MKTKIIPQEEVLQNKIFLIRGKKVMLDSNLAELYGVETEHLTRQVRRNIDRIPRGLPLSPYAPRGRKLDPPIWWIKLGRYKKASIFN